MNNIDLFYDNDSYRKLAPKKAVLDYIGHILDSLDLQEVEFSVSFIVEENMQFLNKAYRNIDSSTDILSFAEEDTTGDGFQFISAGRRRMLGDILICPEVLARNAEAFGVSVNEELSRLLIHGILHLSGEDHETSDFATEPMLQKQEKILQEIGELSQS